METTIRGLLAEREKIENSIRQNNRKTE